MSKNNLVLLIKFIKPHKKFIRDFKNGNLFFTPLIRFINEEKLTGIAKWGDKHEGQIHNDLNPWKVHPKLFDESGNFIGKLDP